MVIGDLYSAKALTNQYGTKTKPAVVQGQLVRDLSPSDIKARMIFTSFQDDGRPRRIDSPLSGGKNTCQGRQFSSLSQGVDSRDRANRTNATSANYRRARCKFGCIDGRDRLMPAVEALLRLEQAERYDQLSLKLH